MYHVPCTMNHAPCTYRVDKKGAVVQSRHGARYSRPTLNPVCLLPFSTCVAITKWLCGRSRTRASCLVLRRSTHPRRPAGLWTPHLAPSHSPALLHSPRSFTNVLLCEPVEAGVGVVVGWGLEAHWTVWWWCRWGSAGAVATGFPPIVIWREKYSDGTPPHPRPHSHPPLLGVN